jgi:hypothetical protein
MSSNTVLLQVACSVTTRLRSMQHYHVCQTTSAVSADCKRGQEACLIVCYDEWRASSLSLAIHTLRVEKKPLLSLLFIESSLPSEEGVGDQQMMPNLLNKVFSAKSTQCVQFRCHKESYNSVLETYKRGRKVTDIHTELPYPSRMRRGFMNIILVRQTFQSKSGKWSQPPPPRPALNGRLRPNSSLETAIIRETSCSLAFCTPKLIYYTITS